MHDNMQDLTDKMTAEMEHLLNRYGVYLVAKRGKGKTTLLAHFGCLLMTPPISTERLQQIETEIAKLNAGGWDNLYLEETTDHSVYVVKDIFIAKGMGYHETISMEIDFKKLGLYNGSNEVEFALPFSDIFAPEIQSELNSRKTGKEDDGMTDEFLALCELARKKEIRFWTDTQIKNAADFRFRSFADRVIEVLGHKHQYGEFDEVIKTTWTTIEFDSIEEYEQYCTTGKGKPDKRTYTHYGDIYECVDSYAGKEYHYSGMDDSNFHQKKAVPTGGYNKKDMLARVAKYPRVKPKDGSGSKKSNSKQSPQVDVSTLTYCKDTNTWI